MKNLLHHLFLPHHTNNQKAKILHHDSILLVALLIIIASFFLASAQKSYSQVIGTAIHIAVQDLLNLTNQNRQKAGSGPLVLNDQLTQAAELKAQNMFAEDYWSHNNHEGKMPWDFIKGAGYDYIYAGENLARGFTTANDVIDAWMASPSHRENMLSPNYRDVGFALEKGNLTGEKDTLLIVEMLGSKTYATNALNQHTPLSQQVYAQASSQQENQREIITNPLINAAPLARNISIFLLAMFILVFLVDVIIIKRRNIIRVASHNIDHIFFLSLVFISVFLLQSGAIY